MEAVQYLKSKSVWNQLAMVAVMVGAMFGIDIPAEYTNEVAAGIAAVFAIAGIVIRRFTTQPLSEK